MCRRNLGFTLIELLVTLAVAAILLVIGVPQFQSVINRNQVAAVTNNFVSALSSARSEAAKGGAITTLCMSSNGAACTGNSGWANGWIIWSDRNNNGALDNGEIIGVQGPLIAGKATVGGGAQTSFSFNGQGALTTAAGGDTINACTPSDLTLSNQIKIDASGHVQRIANPTLGNCP
ncbi:MAG: GspH/FimT family pseudopilin [Thiobacillaceae bacterium]|jgi:type IV fimbrial biogenesis protein FimT